MDGNQSGRLRILTALLVRRNIVAGCRFLVVGKSESAWLSANNRKPATIFPHGTWQNPITVRNLASQAAPNDEVAIIQIDRLPRPAAVQRIAVGALGAAARVRRRRLQVRWPERTDRLHQQAQYIFPL